MEFSIALRVRTKQDDNFYFLSFSALSNLFWLEMTPYWFYDNFLTFFAISLEFSITCWVGTERNDNTYFLSFPSFSNLFWLEMKPQRYFIIFWIFLLFFLNFVLRTWLEWNGTIIIIFSRSHSFPPYFGFKRSHNGIL